MTNTLTDEQKTEAAPRELALTGPDADGFYWLDVKAGGLQAHIRFRHEDGGIISRTLAAYVRQSGLAAKARGEQS